MKKYFLILFYSILILNTCLGQSKIKNKKDPFVKSIASNQKKIIAILQNNKYRSDFFSIGGIMINNKGVDYFQSILDTAHNSGLFNVNFNLANQLLQSGKNDDAIEKLQKLLCDPLLLTSSNAAIKEKVRKTQALAFLRKGEQLNCIYNHHAESCILPIIGNGVYIYQEATKEAVKLYEDILLLNEADIESRWLLNIAYMSLGIYPDSVPNKYFIDFKRNKTDVELAPFKDVAIDLGLDINDMSGSVCMEDFDNDGNLDLFITAEGYDSQMRYFRNNGDGTFSDRTDESGLKGEVSARVCVHADYNNDGNEDIFVCRGAWQIQENNYPPSSLLRNNGDGTFTDVTIESGLLGFSPSYCASWADFNNDGWIDLFVSNETSNEKFPHPCKLYKNNGNGSFSDVSSESNLNLTGWMKGVVWGDYNLDGFQDLFVSTFNKGHKLFKNNGIGSDGKLHFSDVTDAAGVGLPRDGLPSMFFDYNNDGWPDIFASSFFSNENTSIPLEYLGGKVNSRALSKLYRNNKDGSFSDVSKEANLDRIIHAMGLNFGDIDNDGFLDFYAGTGDLKLSYVVPNLMFQNINGNSFREVGEVTRTANIQKGHGIAFGDIDNDGDQDIYEVMGGGLSGDVYPNNFYENPGNNNNWINIKLIGKKSNRSAIGARIKIIIERDGKEIEIYSVVNTGASFGASSLQQEIGLGKASQIKKIIVYWPSTNITQEFLNVKMNQFYRVIEEDPMIQVLNKMKINFSEKTIKTKSDLHH